MPRRRLATMATITGCSAVMFALLYSNQIMREMAGSDVIVFDYYSPYEWALMAAPVLCLLFALRWPGLSLWFLVAQSLAALGIAYVFLMDFYWIFGFGHTP